MLDKIETFKPQIPLTQIKAEKVFAVGVCIAAVLALQAVALNIDIHNVRLAIRDCLIHFHLAASRMCEMLVKRLFCML